MMVPGADILDETEASFANLPEWYGTREIIPGKHFLPIQNNVFESILSALLAERFYDEDNPIFKKLHASDPEILKSARDTDCGQMIELLLGDSEAGVNGYQLPPEFDFIHFRSKPFQMIVVPFYEHLKKQDLVNIYQGICQMLV